MPFYVYHNKETDEYVEVLQGMNDKHEYIDSDGVVWDRVFLPPQIGIDTVKLDPFSKKDYLKKTDKNGTVGELMDRSKEFSERRKAKEGIDIVEEKFKEKYSKTRNGRKLQTTTGTVEI